ncbi:MAG: IS5 family transposase [Halobacteriota archaeon]|jgi:transposase
MLAQELLEARKERGLNIAKTCKITKNGNGWIVPSQSNGATYDVEFSEFENTQSCTCPDYQYRKIKCKHIFAVELIVTEEINEEGTVTQTVTKRVSYAQNWQAYDHAQIHQKELFMQLLGDVTSTIPQPKYTFGRPKLPLADMVFSSALKVFSTFSLRRFATDMEVAKERGLIDKVPYYSTVARYMESPELTPIIKDLITITSLALASVENDFTIDSSGFGTSRFIKWFDHKYGKDKDVRTWVKAHVACGVKTNIVTAVELTMTNERDSKFLPELVMQTAQNFTVKEVSGDKAYSSRANLELINEIGAVPYIPFRKGTTGRAKNAPTWKKMYHYFEYKNAEFLEHYHKRSNAETTFHMIKSKFGDSVRSKMEAAQVNEVLLKVLCHNICVVIQEMFELGIEPEFFDEY